jgi:uncharacterized protein (DUF111 family)
MPRRCTICHHPQHEDIAVSVFRDGTRTTARRFQVSRSALDRHKRHFHVRIVEAQQAEAVCEPTLKVRSHPAVSCAIYTHHCQDVCEATRKSHQEQRDACKAFVASERQHGWRALLLAILTVIGPGQPCRDPQCADFSSMSRKA